jgi:hypothetical protein
MRYHLIALGIVIAAAATAISAQPAYRLEGNGSIWVNTGPCIDAKCTWQLLDHNPNTLEITATGVASGGFNSPNAPTEDPSKAPALYQRHADGKIWFYTGTPCKGGSCPGWQMPDNNQQTVSIVAAGFPDPKNLILYRVVAWPNGVRAFTWIRGDDCRVPEKYLTVFEEVNSGHHATLIDEFITCNRL